MENLVWYIYQNGKQIGPFDNSQLTQMVVNGMVQKDAYLFKAGWKEWRPIEDVSEELNSLQKPATTTPPTFENKNASPVEQEKVMEGRRKYAPRATINGQVIVHNGGDITIGKGVNISSSGIFVESAKTIFKLGETLKLTVRCDGMAKPFNVQAKVIRYNEDQRYSIGYGLKFCDLEEDFKHQIEEIVAGHNQA